MLVLATTGAGCSAPDAKKRDGAPALAAPLALSLVADFNIPTGTKYEGVELGGISAIAYSGQRNRWLALSDYRRLYELEIDPASRPMKVVPRRLVQLGWPGRSYFDPEGLVVSVNGTLFISTEGNLRKQPIVEPELFEIGADGDWIGSRSIPQKFLVADRSAGKGSRHNHGFEALAIAPDGKRLYLGTEYPLLQDGEPADFERAGYSRLLEIFLEQGDHGSREYVYIVEPMERPPGFENPAIHRGITELVALAPDYFLALERSYIEEGKKGAYRIEIFSVSLDGATDVSDLESLESLSDWIPVTKTLLIDLATIVPQLTPPYQSLENFEGMALGPALAGGGRSLLVASDNNFFEHQRTAFLLFRLTGKPGGP